MDPVLQWLKERYPKPSVDPEWLGACVNWIQESLNLSLENIEDHPEIIHHVELQLLQSDLSDSMLTNTGLPRRVLEFKAGVIGTPQSGGGILVQITSITEIGNSAFHLANIRQARIDKTDLNGLSVEEGEDGEADPGALMKYPRSMLKLTLSDGSISIPAIEFQRIPAFVLGETRLGFKLVLKSVRIRNGIALLEPGNVGIKGYENDELEATQELTFLKSLRQRMMKPVDDIEAQQAQQAQQPAAAVERSVPIEYIPEPQVIVQDRHQIAHAPVEEEALFMPSDEEMPSAPVATNNISSIQAPQREAVDADNDSFDMMDEDDEAFWQEAEVHFDAPPTRPRPPQPAPQQSQPAPKKSSTVQAKSRPTQSSTQRDVPSKTKKATEVELIELDTSEEDDAPTVSKPALKEVPKPKPKPKAKLNTKSTTGWSKSATDVIELSDSD